MTQADAPLLDVRGVTLQYKTREHLVTATYRVDFQVLRSDRFVLLGPSGCGKSTLLKAAGGYLAPVEGETEADMARQHAEAVLEVIKGEGFAKPNPRPMFPNPPGLLRGEPHSEGLRDRIWWGSATDATAAWAAKRA